MLTSEENEMLTHVGRGTPMGELLRRFWVPFLLSNELPGPDCPPVRVRLLGEDLVAFRDTQGKVGLVDAYCAHRRAPLFFGRNEDGGLRCVYHGWKYDRQGNCVDMPSEPPESGFKSKIKITSYLVHEQKGVVWAYLGPPERLPKMPALEWLDLQEGHQFVTKRHERANFVQAVEGGIDTVHVPYLHSRVSSHQSRSTAPKSLGFDKTPIVAYLSTLKAPRYKAKQTPYGVMLATRRPGEGETDTYRLTLWLMPFYNMFASESARGDGVANGRGLMWTPIDDNNCWAFSVTWDREQPLNEVDRTDAEAFSTEVIPGTFIPIRNKDNDYLIDREAQRTVSFTGIQGFQPQDLAVQEGMGPIVDRTKEHLGTSDAAIILIRRHLLKAAMDLREGIEPFQAQHGELYRVWAREIAVKKEEELNDKIMEALTVDPQCA